METASIHIYLPAEEVAKFRIWARLEGVKVVAPDEIQMVNSSHVPEVVYVAQKMVAELPLLISTMRKMKELGKSIIGVGTSEKKLEIKTERQIKKAISLKWDLWCLKGNYKKEETVKITSKPMRRSAKGKISTPLSKMKTSILILALAVAAIAPLASAQNPGVPTNGPLAFRTWRLVQGKKFEGRVVGFATNGFPRILGKDGKLYSTALTNFLSADRDFLEDARPRIEAAMWEAQAAARQKVLDDQLKIFMNAGYMELTAELFDHYPEKIAGKKCWIDARFLNLNALYTSDKSMDIGFDVSDKKGEWIQRIHAPKADDHWEVGSLVMNRVKLDDKILQLTKGDKIRLTGTIYPTLPGERIWYEIDSITRLP